MSYDCKCEIILKLTDTEKLRFQKHLKSHTNKVKAKKSLQKDNLHNQHEEFYFSNELIRTDIGLTSDVKNKGFKIKSGRFYSDRENEF